MEFLFPEYRLNWFDAGPSSPNKTGALLALIFIAAWWPSLRFRWGYWLSLPASFVAMCLLLQTESRGALVAAGAAAVLLTVFQQIVSRHRRCAGEQQPYVLWVRALTMFFALGLLFIYAQQLGVNNRMAAIASGDDGSSNVRVALYSAGMQMIADAPFGWGHGQAGNAYGQWYQEIGDSRSYLSLVNSHLTWMADYGMVFQFFYIAGWVLVFLLCWPFEVRSGVYNALRVLQPSSQDRNEDDIGMPSLRLVATASWIVLILCGVFSSVLTLVWLWVIPCALLLLCLFERTRSKIWPSKRQSQIACLTAILAFFGLQSMAHAFAWGNQIAADPESIELGKAPKTVAIVYPDRQIVGDKYGHTIREYLEDLDGVTVLRKDSAQADLSTFEILVFSGSFAHVNLADFTGRLVWLNPPANVDDATLESFSKQTLTIVVGSLGDWRRVRLWQSLAEENPKWNLIELRGVADFIPGWPKYLEPFHASQDSLMKVNKALRPRKEIYGYDERCRVASAPESGCASGFKNEEGAKATLLRSKSVSRRFKRRLSVVTVSSEAFRRRGKRLEKIALGGASYG